MLGLLLFSATQLLSMVMLACSLLLLMVMFAWSLLLLMAMFALCCLLPVILVLMRGVEVGGLGGWGGGGWGGNEVMFLRVLVLQSLLSSSELLPRTQSPWQTILFGAGRGGGLSRFACSCRHYYIRVEWLGRGKSRGRVACALSN